MPEGLNVTLTLFLGLMPEGLNVTLTPFLWNRSAYAESLILYNPSSGFI